MRSRTANKPAIESGSGDDTSAATTGYTTRLTGAQADAIGRASSLLGQTPAKFIREAAVQFSAHVLNASGSNRIALHHLARTLVEGLVNPKARVTGEVAGHAVEGNIDFAVSHAREPGTPTAGLMFHREFDQGGRYEFLLPDVDAWDLVEKTTLKDVFPLRIDEGALRGLKTGLETAGVEFARILLAELAARESGTIGYRPTIDPSTLLGAEASRHS